MRTIEAESDCWSKRSSHNDEQCSFCMGYFKGEPNGTISRYNRRNHFDSQFHKSHYERMKLLGVCAEVYERDKLASLDIESARRQVRKSYLDQLLIGIVATRLRAKHGSFELAREQWSTESKQLLNHLNHLALEQALFEPAVAALATAEIQAIAVANHELLGLIDMYVRETIATPVTPEPTLPKRRFVLIANRHDIEV